MKVDRSFFWIASSVVAVHAFFLVWLAFGAPWMDINSPPKKSRLVTRTVKLQPPTPVAAAAPVSQTPPPKKAAPPLPKPKKKVEKKKEPRKVEPPKKKPEKKKGPSKRDKLLAKAQESIAKIDQQHDKVKGAATSETVKIGSLHIDSLSVEEIGYKDELVARLKRDLKLPEEGEVDLKLTITKGGSVAHVAIVAAKSEKNSKYLETSLPALNLPGYGERFGGAREYTFFLTLTNE